MNVISAQIEIRFKGESAKSLAVIINGEPVQNERTRRHYCSASDALVSARHILREFENKNPNAKAKR